MNRNSAFQGAKRALALALLLSISSSALFAQAVAPATSGLSAVDREIAEKITIASIKDMTTALVAPDMEGRGTGQPGGDKAANWIAEKYKSLG